jgi:long-chain acyl-CoA synthetase
VSVVLPNCPQHVLTVFAVLRLGGVVVQHDPASTASELHAEFARCGARSSCAADRCTTRWPVVQTAPPCRRSSLTSLADYAPSRTRLRTRLRCRRAPPRDRLSAPLHPDAATVPFLRLVRTATAARQTPVDPRDPALLQYTGGTTGCRARPC